MPFIPFNKVPIVPLRHQTQIDDALRRRSHLKTHVWTIIINKVVLIHSTQPTQMDIIIQTLFVAIEEYGNNEEEYLNQVPEVLKCLFNRRLMHSIAICIAEEMRAGRWAIKQPKP